MIQMNKLLHTAVKIGASDLHLAVGRPPIMRVRGALRPLSTSVLTAEDTAALMKSITPERAQQEIQETGSTDFAFAFDEGATRFRVAAFKQKGAVGLVLRQIPNKLLSFNDLGLDRRIQQLLHATRGLILITGPTGAGKTTTLATMIDYINANLECHIVTIEDPIEYYHPHKRSLVTQREVGTDVPTFSEALRRALRQDPDVILVGEMRDLETMEAALTAAETGHLVLGTLHTNSAQGTVNRIIDAFPMQEQEQVRIQLSTTLVAVLSQQLVQRVDKSGMVAVYEILLMTPAIANLIRDNKTYRIDSAIQTGAEKGMRLLDDALVDLYVAGTIRREDAVHRCHNRDAVLDRLAEIDQRRGIPAGHGQAAAPRQEAAAGGTG